CTTVLQLNFDGFEDLFESGLAWCKNNSYCTALTKPRNAAVVLWTPVVPIFPTLRDFAGFIGCAAFGIMGEPESRSIEGRIAMTVGRLVLAVLIGCGVVQCQEDFRQEITKTYEATFSAMRQV